MPPFIHAALFYAGAATLAAPIVIHLIFRMRKRRVVFSSLRFLQQSMLKESRRLKLRELLLLLLRCLACVLIAAAFGRPYFSGSTLAGPNGRVTQDVVLVLDDSPSLAAQEGAGTRWQELLKKAREEISARSSGDRVGVVLSSDPARAEIELSGNFGAVSGALKNDRPSSKRGDLAQAMNTATELLAGSTQPKRRVVVFSDFQTSAVDRGAWATVAQKAAGSGSGGIAVELLGPASLGQGAVRLPNLAVTDVRAKSDVWIDGRPVPFVVRVANYGDNEVPNVSVKLVVDGKPVATRAVGLGPRSSTEVEIEALFPRTGEVFGNVEIDAHDCFPDDDKRLFALRLRDSIKVLVVEEKLAESEAFLDQGYFIRMALEPKARGEGENRGAPGTPTGGSAFAGNYIQVVSSEIARVTPEMLKTCDLIVVCGVTAMNDVEVALLEDAVREGKNLIVFTGRADGRMSESFYNGSFWKNGLGLLPARPGALYEGNRLENKFDKIGDFNISHPLFKAFTGENDANLRLPRYYRHYQASPADLKIGVEEKSDAALKPAIDPKVAPKTDPKNPADAKEAKAALKSRPAGTVLASFTGDGGPFAMERPYGKGIVLMFPFAPRPEATDLPKRKAFVPLLHQAVRWLAGVQSASRRSLVAGDTFVFADAGAPGEAAVSLEKPPLPDGKKETLTLTGNDHPVADAPGIYTASFARGAIKERTLWAVNIDPRESELVSDPLGTLKAIFATVIAADTTESKAAAAQLSDEQKALATEWRWCLIAALCCLMLEVALRDFWKS